MNYLSPLFAELYENSVSTIFQGVKGVSEELVLNLSSDLKKHPNYPDQTNRIQKFLNTTGSDSGLISPKMIAKLQNPSVKFVVTGQQPDLLGGPLFVFCKMLTCIELAKKYEMILKCPVVPLFWIAGDDSDLDEVNLFESVRSGKVFRFPIPGQKGKQVQNYILNPGDLEMWTQFLNSHQHLAGSEMADLIQPGLSLDQIFLRFWRIFPWSEEVLWMQGGSEWVQRESQEFLTQWVIQQNTIAELLSQSENKLKAAGFKAQVPTHLKFPRVFNVVNGVRKRLYYNELEESSWSGSLSHDVLSRPLLTQFLFPVLAHVLGPGELNYFAQIQSLFEFFQLPKPLIVQRCHLAFYRNADKSLASEFNLERFQWTAFKTSDWQALHRQKIKVESQNTGSPLAWNRNYFRSFAIELDELQHLHEKLKNWNHEIEEKILSHKAKEQVLINQKIQDTSFWMGMGRKQERVLRFFELNQMFPYPDWIGQIDFLNPDFQLVKVV